MTDEQVCETVEKYGANQEECARLNASLSCLRNVHMSGEQAGHLPQSHQVPVPAAAGLDEAESTLGGKCHMRAEERGLALESGQCSFWEPGPKGDLLRSWDMGFWKIRV